MTSYPVPSSSPFPSLSLFCTFPPLGQGTYVQLHLSHASMRRADGGRPRVDEVGDAVAVRGHVLLCDHLDGFLGDHAAEEGCDVGEVGCWGACAAGVVG